METRPRVPRTGTAPRHPVGHHPAATRRRETRPAAPATRGGWNTRVPRGERGRKCGALARRAHPRDGEAPNPLGYGQGRLGGGLSRWRTRWRQPSHTREEGAGVQCACSVFPDGRPAGGMVARAERAPALRDREGGRGTRGPTWGPEGGGATWSSALHLGVHTWPIPRYPADPVQLWSIPHPHSAPHPLPGLRPGAQTHQVRGQWPHSAATHSHSWSGGARVGTTCAAATSSGTSGERAH